MAAASAKGEKISVPRMITAENSTGTIMAANDSILPRNLFGAFDIQEPSILVTQEYVPVFIAKIGDRNTEEGSRVCVEDEQFPRDNDDVDFFEDKGEGEDLPNNLSEHKQNVFGRGHSFEVGYLPPP